MFIGSSRNLNKKVKDNCVLLNNAPIPRADTFTCLGVDLDEKVSWEKHIEKNMWQGQCRNWGDEAYKILCPICHSTNYLQNIGTAVF